MRDMPTPAHHLLLVDDDVELCALLEEYLQGEGMTVESVHNGNEGLERALNNSYSIVVLDVMLPGMQGLEVLRRIRAESNIPVVMLTARGEEVDRIVGLEVGADDYVPKPFNPRELLARMRAVLRRTSGSSESAESMPLAVGDITIDAARRFVACGGDEIQTTAAEFDLLSLFLNHPGQVIDREQIAQQVLGRSFYAHDRSIDMHVSKLRRKLGPHPDGSDRLKSIRSVGYIYTLPSGDDKD